MSPGEQPAPAGTKQRQRRALAEGGGKKMAGKSKDAAAGEGEEAKGGKKKLIFILLPLVAVIAAAAWFLVLKPAPASKGPVKPSPGTVTALDPITINLAGGHYLKLGMALQAKTGASVADGSQALDAAIEEYSGMTINQLASRRGRDQSKAQLIKTVAQLYDDKVYDIYFTTFVYQ